MDARVAGVPSAHPGSPPGGPDVGTGASHPYSLAWVRCWATYVSQCCRNVAAVHAQAEAAMALSPARSFPPGAALGMCLRGWALAMQGQGEEGVAQVRSGALAYRATGAAMGVPYLCTVGGRA